ncbi:MULTISPECIES: hypothetical protein [Oceanobacillus]|uniref:hypothetical protein n=1 Tax=Oceanobacillus TaxID=182709 RepID=UPI0005958EC5|nr:MULTISPECIES: hypothetical protein [Oceanobacillus]
MNQSTMNIFQTYKSLMLKKAWQEDIKILKKKANDIIYEKAFSFKKFVHLSLKIIGIAIAAMFVLMVLNKSEAYNFMDFIKVLPLTILVLLYSFWLPIATILILLGGYSVIKVKLNKKRGTKRILAIEQEIEEIESNLKIIQDALDNHSVVPAQYQTEPKLEIMMDHIKNGFAESDQQAIMLYADHLNKGSINQYNEQQHKRENNMRKFVVITLLLSIFESFRRK